MTTPVRTIQRRRGLAAAALFALCLAACGAPPEDLETDGPLGPGPLTGGVAVADPAAWPGFGGPHGDFTVPGDGLATAWPIEGPPTLWSRALGAGYAGVAAADGALYTMYRDGNDDVVTALTAADGATRWEYRYAAPAREDHVTQFGTGPNATPLVLSDRVVTLGYSGALHALDRASGEMLWSTNLLDDLGGDVLPFGYAASPVLDDGRVVVLVGGERGAVAALDPADGTLVWRSPAGSVSYATPRTIEVDGMKQLVYFAADEVVGLDPTDGTRLWSWPCVNQYENNATPIQWTDDNLLWVATQLDGGARALRLGLAEDGSTTVEEVWRNSKVSIHFWNSMLRDDHVYASIGGNASIMAAVSMATGEIAWRERGFAQTNLVQAGDLTIVLDEKGELALARLSPAGLEVLSQTRVVEGPAWTAPTLVGTTLFLRDAETIRALDLGAGAS